MDGWASRRAAIRWPTFPAPTISVGEPVLPFQGEVAGVELEQYVRSEEAAGGDSPFTDEEGRGDEMLREDVLEGQHGHRRHGRRGNDGARVLDELEPEPRNVGIAPGEKSDGEKSEQPLPQNRAGVIPAVPGEGDDRRDDEHRDIELEARHDSPRRRARWQRVFEQRANDAAFVGARGGGDALVADEARERFGHRFVHSDVGDARSVARHVVLAGLGAKDLAHSEQPFVHRRQACRCCIRVHIVSVEPMSLAWIVYGFTNRPDGRFLATLRWGSPQRERPQANRAHLAPSRDRPRPQPPLPSRSRAYTRTSR